MNSTSDSAAEYPRARTRQATVTDPHLLELRAEITDLLADNQALRRERDTLNTLLDASLARERESDRAVRELLALINGTPRGALWALWDTLRGRTR
jgi:regulator of replication initiation timing